MVGFGHEEFGEFPFGGAEWAKTVLDDATPQVYIEEDNDQSGQPLQTLYKVLRQVVEPLRRKIDRLSDLRDPRRVPFTFDVVGFGEFNAGNQALMRSAFLSGAVTFTNGSNVVTGSGSAFASELLIGSAIRPPGTAFQGRVLQIADDGSLVLQDVWPGATVTTDPDEAERVEEIGVVLLARSLNDPLLTDPPFPSSWTTTDTRLVVALPVPENVSRTRSDYVILDSTQVGQLEKTARRDTGLAVALGGDYGVDIDDSDAESVSRSAIANVTQFLPLKGLARSYQILGAVYGFNVEVYPLWLFDMDYYDSLYLAERGYVFEDPIGSGHWVTSVPPLYLTMDELPLDAEPLDIGPLDSELVIYQGNVVGIDPVFFILFFFDVPGQPSFTDIVSPGMFMDSAGNRFLITKVWDFVPGTAKVSWEALVPGTVPQLGIATFTPQFALFESSRYAKTARLLVVIEPVLPGQGTSRLVDRVIERFQEVKPIHVRLARVNYRVNIRIEVSPRVTLTNQSSLASTFFVSRSIDDSAVDEVSTDSGIVVTGDAL